MAQSPKILILILSTKDQSYNGFIQACKNTWVQHAEDMSIRCLFYQGGADKDYLDNNTLNLVADDSLAGTGQKLMKAFHFIEREGFNYDYIFRTNLSSYIYVENLLKFIEQYHDDNLYSGLIGTYNKLSKFANKFDVLNRICLKISSKHSLKFASGSGFMISRSNVRKVLIDPLINLSLVDDVMIGECLSRHGIPITKSTRIDLNDDKVIYSNDIVESLDLIKTCFHIRLKSKDRSIDVNRFFLLDKYKSFQENYY